MSITSKIEAGAESREESRAAQTVEVPTQTVVVNSENSSATPKGDGLNSAGSCEAPSPGASMAESSKQAEEAGEFEEFTLDDIEVIESKVFA